MGITTIVDGRTATNHHEHVSIITGRCICHLCDVCTRSSCSCDKRHVSDGNDRNIVLDSYPAGPNRAARRREAARARRGLR